MSEKALKITNHLVVVILNGLFNEQSNYLLYLPVHEFEYKVINEKLYEIPYIAINKNNMYPTDESSHKVYTVLSGEFVRWGNNCNTHIVQFSGGTTNVL